MSDNSAPPYTIGFFTTGTNSEYSILLARMVTQVAKEKNINLINFLGGSLNPNFTFSQYKYQYQCNVAFNFADTPQLDGIILASGVLASFLDSTDFFDFYSQFKPTPIVSLGMNLPDIPSAYTDNKSIFYELVSHLIQVHNRKKIGFISGPSSNTDAFDRYLGYTSALADNHITYHPDYVYLGDFTSLSANNAVRTLLDERQLDLDAIVCANDAMALTIINDLKKRDILIPEQIIVTGCDNISSSAYYVPSLTTIEQSLEEMAHAAFDLLLQTIEGYKPENVVVPSKIVYRESCGCHIMPYSSIISALALPSSTEKASQLTDNFLHKCSNTLPQDMILQIRNFVTKCYSLVLSGEPTELQSPQKVVESFLAVTNIKSNSIQTVLNLKSCMSSLKSDLLNLSQNPTILCYLDTIFSQITHTLFNQLLDYYSLKTDRLDQSFDFTRQFLLTITHNIRDKEQQLQSIIPVLMETGITSCLIYLYADGVKHNLSDTWKMPEDIYLYMGYLQGQIIDPSTLPLKMNSKDIALYGFKTRKENYVACIHPIFFGNEQLGVIVFEMDIDNYSLIDNLTVELGCALKLTSTFTTQRQIENKLATLSQTDELTGLLNRRGFFNLAQDKYDFSLADHQSGILFYADMDGLKTINDTYGHNEGDFAIITMSQILKKAFTNHDVVGRIGGDEFVILSTNQDTGYMEHITNKVNSLCDEFNASNLKPYTLSISIGAIFYFYEDDETLEYLLSRADQILYEQKKLKKKRKHSQIENDHYDLI